MTCLVAIQAQTFRGFVQGGANFSQIDGDNLAGYNRVGGAFGAGVWYDLADRWRSSLTFAFAQNGSRASGREAQTGNKAFSKIGLNYVTVPINIHYMDWLSEDELYYKLEFTAGLEYRRLISSETLNGAEVNIDAFTSYNTSGVGLLLGVWYSSSERMAFGLHHNWGVLSANVPNQPVLLTKQVYLQIRRAF